MGTAQAPGITGAGDDITGSDEVGARPLAAARLGDPHPLAGASGAGSAPATMQSEAMRRSGARTPAYTSPSVLTMSFAGPVRAARYAVPAHRLVPCGSSKAAEALRIGEVIWLTSG